MAVNCGKISANAMLAKCGASTPAVKGRIILMNFDDIDVAGSTVTDGVLSALVMKNNAKGYAWETHDRAVEVNSPLAPKTYYNVFEHNLVVRVFDKTQEIKDQINALAYGRVVAIVENRSNANAETHYEVYGWDSGLIMTAQDSPSTDGDGVIYTITLNSDENSQESQLPLSFYTGDLATTETAIEALLATAQ